MPCKQHASKQQQQPRLVCSVCELGVDACTYAQGEALILDDAQKLLLLQIALKCADLGHVAEDHDVHLRYARYRL